MNSYSSQPYHLSPTLDFLIFLKWTNSIPLVNLSWNFSFMPFFSIFSKSSNKKLTIISSCHWYLILIPTVIILVPELITSQWDCFNNFLADLSWLYSWPLQYFLYTTAFFMQFIFDPQNPSRLLLHQQNKFKIPLSMISDPSLLTPIYLSNLMYSFVLPSWLRQWRISLQCRRIRYHPWIGKIPRRRECYPPPYSCLENSTDRGSWRAIVHGITKSQSWLSE